MLFSSPFLSFDQNSIYGSGDVDKCGSVMYVIDWYTSHILNKQNNSETKQNKAIGEPLLSDGCSEQKYVNLSKGIELANVYIQAINTDSDEFAFHF